MSVKIKSVKKNSSAYRAGIISGDVLLNIDGNEICDVLDYRFYADAGACTFCIKRGDKEINLTVDCENDLGIEFETYLMDEHRSCKNKCMFCFIDQMPKGMRESLYFKDDDSRLSFLFGNYITLTNLSEHEIDRIIKMHISPVNISVHTTNPELRVKMMNNRFAGEALSIMKRFSDAGIKMNCQIVCCPGVNDGDELVRSLRDLSSLDTVECVSVVPVGLTCHREGLCNLECHSKESAGNVIDIVDSFYDGKKRRFYASDELYLLANRPIPDADFYGEFLQLENGVGLCALTKKNALEALKNTKKPLFSRKVGIVTGVAATPLIKDIIDRAQSIWHNLDCEVFSVKNDFFGPDITVAGLVTGGDIIKQLGGKKLPKELIIPSCMLREGNGIFLDDYTVDDIKKALKVKKITVVSPFGDDTVAALAGHKLKKRRKNNG